MSKGHYLTAEEMKRVKLLLEKDFNYKQIAEITGLSHTTIGRVARGEHALQRPAPPKTGSDAKPPQDETTINLLIEINKKLDRIIELWG